MRIYFFLKFFQEEHHARAFVAGRLYLNPLAYFKGLEEGPDDGRADPHEAPLAWHQPAQLGLIELAGVRINPADLAAPLIIQGVDANALNVLCLYAGASAFERPSAANIEALIKEHLRVPERCRTMGPFAVLIAPPQVFKERVAEAATRHGFELQGGAVHYFDPDSFSGAVERPAFTKKRKFDWHRGEYRFALDRHSGEASPYMLNVGPLADICTIVDAARVTEPVVVMPASVGPS